MRAPLPIALALALALAACDGKPSDEPTREDRVRDAASAYLAALEDGRWARACDLLTGAARRELGAAGGSCAAALAGGSALPGEELAAAGREVAGAAVRVRGRSAAIGPLGSFPEPLRLERVDGRWLVAG